MISGTHIFSQNFTVDNFDLLVYNTKLLFSACSEWVFVQEILKNC